MTDRAWRLLGLWCAGLLLGLTPAVRQPNRAGTPPDSVPARFGWGRAATSANLAAFDGAIRPNGRGLPTGSSTATAGRRLYAARCAACHGGQGEGGPGGALRPPEGAARRDKTIGTYWPYATTMFDYIRRAMPQNAPGTLTDSEVYALTAYLLHLNKLVDSSAVLDARTLPKIDMPARRRFVPDDRRGGPEIR
jgi:mono/diheme cytochrome c family protein